MKSNTSRSEATTTDGEIITQLPVVLGNTRRRIVLDILMSGPQPFEKLVDVVMETEHSRSDGEYLEISRTDVALSLYHLHLPKLAQEGIVAADYVDGDVALTRAGAACANVIDDGLSFGLGSGNGSKS